MAGDGPPHRVLVGDVTLDDRQIGVLNGQGLGPAHERGHFVALREGLVNALAAGATGCTEDDEFHILFLSI